MRDCGCPKGRKCTCEKDVEEDFSCGTCEMCLKVQAQRKKGKGKAKIMSKCLRARLYKDRHLHDYIAMGDADFILKMPKALKEDVLHLKPKFQEIYQMRIILNEEKPKYELQIKEETQYIRKYGLQLDDVRKRQQKILALYVSISWVPLVSLTSIETHKMPSTLRKNKHCRKLAPMPCIIWLHRW